MSRSYVNYSTIFFIASIIKKGQERHKVGSGVVFDIISCYYDHTRKIKTITEIRIMCEVGST